MTGGVGQIQTSPVRSDPHRSGWIFGEACDVARAHSTGVPRLERKLYDLAAAGIEHVDAAAEGSNPDATVACGVKTRDAGGTQRSIAPRGHPENPEVTVRGEAANTRRHSS